MKRVNESWDEYEDELDRANESRKSQPTYQITSEMREKMLAYIKEHNINVGLRTFPEDDPKT